jgi:hypothetical protein
MVWRRIKVWGFIFDPVLGWSNSLTSGTFIRKKLYGKSLTKYKDKFFLDIFRVTGFEKVY